MFFAVSPPFLPILLNSFSIGVKDIHFSLLSPKQVSCFLNSANSFMIK